MEYFGSIVLLVGIMSFPLSSLVDLPKIISPSLFPCMTISVMPILMISPFIFLLALVDNFSPCPLLDCSAFVVESFGILAGPVPGDQFETNSIGLALVTPTYQIRKFGVPPSGVLWHPICIWWHAPHLIWDIGWQ
jgi:hypothetical protein